MAQFQSIAAVLVTYKRNDLLRTCLAALEGQAIATVYVVDNASDSETQELIASFRKSLQCRYVASTRNLGGAGGFHIGMKMAVEEGHDAVWLMDDDCVVAENALSELCLAHERISTLGIVTSFLASRVLWTDGTDHRMNIPRSDSRRRDSLPPGMRFIQTASFVSILIPSDAIKSVGFPNANYFIWFDDTEYTLRLNEVGSGILVERSIAVHQTASNSRANFANLTRDDAWKYRYGLRNLVATYLARKQYISLFRDLLRIAIDTCRGRPNFRDLKFVLTGMGEVPSILREIRKYPLGVPISSD